MSSEQARKERKRSSDEMTGHQVVAFESLIRSEFEHATLSVDKPRDPKGEWWFDFKLDAFKTSVVWRQAQGFGVFTSEGSYGSRPDEVYRTPDLVVRRLVQLVANWRSNASIGGLCLREVRTLVDKAQVDLAERLKVDQGAISRLENRSDTLISTLIAYVQAMGGELQIRVRFDQFDAPIAFGHSNANGARNARSRSQAQRVR
jgi:hypothetical protein